MYRDVGLLVSGLRRTVTFKNLPMIGEMVKGRMSLEEGIDCIVILYPCIPETFLCNVVCRTASQVRQTD